jgi:hypothetical protein
MINYDQEIYNGAITGGATPALAKLLVAQARFESGNYSNSQTKNNNNIFGFKYSKNSPYAKVGNISPEGDAYAHYDTLQDAILDYISRWMSLTSKEGGSRLQEFNKIQEGDTTTYANKLKGYGYFGATAAQYASGLNSSIRRINVVAFYFNNKNAIDYGAIGAVIIGLTYYIYYLYKKKVV